MTLTLGKAGETTFLVHNDTMTEEHEMVLVKLKSADQRIDVVAAKHRIDEKQLKSLGEVSELKPGADGQLKAKLVPVTLPPSFVQFRVRSSGFWLLHLGAYRAW